MANEKFSIGKWFFSLIPASGEQWGKWLDFVWKLLIVILLYIFVWLPIKNRLFPQKTSIPSQAIGSNNGIIATKNEDSKGDSYSLFNLLNWR